MPEQEFELYLSLLGRFLRLKPSQLGEISDELRDHLEARLEELSTRGVSREAAIKQALAEFGDAAELANHFTYLAHIRRRRVIMRFTFGTVAALAASFLVFTALWPESPQLQIPHRAVAQTGAAAKGGGESKGGAPAASQKTTRSKAQNDKRAAIEAKLDQPLDMGLNFSETPLVNAIQVIGIALKVDIVIDKLALIEEGIDIDAPTVDIHIEHTTLTARTALELVLEPQHLVVMVRDGYLKVTTQTKGAEQLIVAVYNVRDLLLSKRTFEPGLMGGFGGVTTSERAQEDSSIRGLAQVGAGNLPGGRGQPGQSGQPGQPGQPNAATGGPGNPAGGANPGTGAAGGMGGGMPGGASGGPSGGGPGMGGMGGGGFFGGKGGMGGQVPMGGPQPGMPVIFQTEALAQLVSITVDPDSWNIHDGAGSVVQYGDRLVVRNTEAVHIKVKELLEMLREAAADDEEGGIGGGFMGGSGKLPSGGAPTVPQTF